MMVNKFKGILQDLHFHAQLYSYVASFFDGVQIFVPAPLVRTEIFRGLLGFLSYCLNIYKVFLAAFLVIVDTVHIKIF